MSARSLSALRLAALAQGPGGALRQAQGASVRFLSEERSDETKGALLAQAP